MRMKYSLAMILLIMFFSSDGQSKVSDSLSNLIAGKGLKGTAKIDEINAQAYRIRLQFRDLSMVFASEALRMSKEINYKKGEADAYVTLGLLFWIKTANERALEYGLDALKISDSIGYRKGQMEANLLLGHVHNELKDFTQAEGFSKRGFEIALELKDAEGIARACNAMGNHFRRRNDGKKALQFYNLGLSYVNSKDDVFSVKCLLLNNIAQYYINSGENKEKTKMYLDEALAISLSVGNKVAELSTRSKLAKIFKDSGDLLKAEEQFKITEKISIEIDSKERLLEAYMNLIEIKTKLGQSREALSYLVKYVPLKDTLFKLERARQIAELEASYETEKKDQTIMLLNQQKSIQQTRELILVWGSLFVALSAVLIYLLQRSRTRKTKNLLKMQQLLNEKLTEVDKLKSGFYANISHEFRTPLTLILAPLENELKKKLSAEGRESMLLIRRSANRLLELVNQLLDLSKLESGKMELRIKEGNLPQLLSVLAASFDSLAQFKRIDFVKDINVEGGRFWFDQDKVEKIVTNLLANAFKFTPADKSISFSADCEDGRTLTIIISDTGAGIPIQEQANVFSPFYQTRQTVTTNQPGTGLGLSLVKELVKLYKGSVNLQSVPGAGTSFKVKLAVDRESFAEDQIVSEASDVLPLQTISSQPDPNNLSSKNIEPFEALASEKNIVLIVEDNTDLREFMLATLQKNHYSVLAASDGKEALRLALQFVPSLVLSDLMMPVMDGIELTKKMKEDERISHIPVILLTAKNETQARIEGLKTGADDYLTKPFSPDELLVRIANLIEQRKKLAERFRERILVPATHVDEISLDDKFLNRARAIIETNLADYTFTVEKMAEEINLSRTQLLRKIKALTGLSPNDFIKDIRLKRAADMIRQKADTITQIGYAVGFNDQSYFTKCFKKQYGMSPSAYSSLN